MRKGTRQLPLLRSLKRLRAAFWRRRVAQGLIRTAWLALLVPTVAMAGYLLWGWQVKWYFWFYPMLLVAFISVIWSLRPINLQKMVHRLDNRLGLRARLITGFESSYLSRSDNQVVSRLLQEAVEISSSLRRQVHALNRNLWLEMQTLIAVAALFSAMLMLDALDPRIPNAAPVGLPADWEEPTAEEVIPPEPSLLPPPFSPEIQTQALSQQQVQSVLQALADALRDQAITRSIAEALDRGDVAGAAEGLRRLADQLGDLSQEARTGLGNALQQASEAIGDNAPGFSQPLQAGREALDGNDLRGSAQALEELADALDSLAGTPQETAQAQSEEGNPQSQGQEDTAGAPPAEQSQPDQQTGSNPGTGAGEGQNEQDNSQPTEEERLAVEGQPLELESDAPLEEEHVLQPAELEAKGGEERTSDSPFARQPLNATTAELGPDPLIYPWQKREVIRSYFTP